MAVILINMNMPKSCSECKFVQEHYEYGEYYKYCMFDRNALSNLHEKLENQIPYRGCPLRPLEKER